MVLVGMVGGGWGQIQSHSEFKNNYNTFIVNQSGYEPLNLGNRSSVNTALSTSLANAIYISG